MQAYIEEQLTTCCMDKVKKYELPTRVLLIKDAFSVEVRLPSLPPPPFFLLLLVPFLRRDTRHLLLLLRHYTKD